MADFNININANVVDKDNILGETITYGDLVYLGGNGKYFKASATTTITSSTEIRIALESGILNETIDMLTYGYHIFTNGQTLIQGTKLYLSVDDGKVTTQRYTSPLYVVRYMGTALNSSTILFNPDQTYIHESGTKINDVSIGSGASGDSVDADPPTFEMARYGNTIFNNQDLDEQLLPAVNDATLGGFHSLKFVTLHNALFAGSRSNPSLLYKFTNPDDLSEYITLDLSIVDFHSFDEITYSVNKDRIYVVMSDENYVKSRLKVWEIDPSNMTKTLVIDDDIGVKITGFTTCIALNDDLFIVNGNYGSTLFKYSTDDYTLSNNIDIVGSLNSVHNIITDGVKLYTTSIWDFGNGSTIARIDPNSMNIDEIVEFVLPKESTSAGITDDSIVIGDYLYCPTEGMTRNVILKINKNDLTDRVELEVGLTDDLNSIYAIAYDGQDIWYAGQGNSFGKFNPDTLVNHTYENKFSYSINELFFKGRVLFATGFDVYPVLNTGYVGKTSVPNVALKEYELGVDGSQISVKDYTTLTKTFSSFVRGIDPVVDADFVTKGFGDANYASFTLPDIVPAYSVQFDIANGQPHSEGSLTWDNDNKTLKMYTDEPDVALQIGQELWGRGFNDTGATIPNGSAVSTIGVDIDGTPFMGLTDASDKASSLGYSGIATHDIEDQSFGYVNLTGFVRDVDTTGLIAGIPMYVSATIPGTFTHVRPESPNWEIRAGGPSKIDAATGILFSEPRIQSNTHSALKFFNGAILESHDTHVDSDGIDITLTIDEHVTGNGYLSLMFDSEFEKFNTPSGIILTPGTDAVPVRNYVYIPKATKVLTVSTTGWPTNDQYVPVGDIMCPTPARAQTEGVYKHHAWTDHLANGNDQGHLSHVNKWIRNRPAQWVSGSTISFDTLPDVETLNLNLAYTLGEVFQLHEHNLKAFDNLAGDNMFVVNDPTTPYQIVPDFNTIDIPEDSEGVSIISRYFKVVLWATVSEEIDDCQLFINLPNASYAANQLSDALIDVGKTANYTITTTYNGTAILLTAILLKSNANGTIELVADGVEDLRGLVPATGAGGGTTGGQGVTLWTELADTPSLYTGHAGKGVIVADSESGLEFAEFARTDIAEIFEANVEFKGNIDVSDTGIINRSTGGQISFQISGSSAFKVTSSYLSSSKKIKPTLTNAYDLGETLLQWRHGFFTGNIDAATFTKVGGLATEFLKADGSVDTSTYLTSFTETDPVFAASPAAGISSANITNWNSAYGWGDHSLVGYISSESDPNAWLKTGATAIVGPIISGDFATFNLTEIDAFIINGNNKSARLLIDNTDSIDGTHNVGIQLSNNSVKTWTIAAYNPEDADYDFSCYNSVLSLSAFHIDGTNNNIGFGTTTPSVKLEVIGDGIFSGGLKSTALRQELAGGVSSLRVDRSDGNIVALYGALSNGGFVYDNTGYFQMFPYSRAAIEGTAYSPPANVGIYMDSVGRVGIQNTGTLTEALEVGGSIIVNNQGGATTTLATFDGLVGTAEIKSDNNNGRMIFSLTHDSVPTAGRGVFVSAVSGQTYGRFGFDGVGTLTWGTGAVDYDTNLYRDSAGVIKTDGRFEVTLDPTDGKHVGNRDFNDTRYLIGGGVNQTSVYDLTKDAYDGNWTLGAGITNNSNYYSLAGAFGNFNYDDANIEIVAGASYLVTVTLDNYVSGSMSVSVGGGSQSATYADADGIFQAVVIAGITDNVFTPSFPVSMTADIVWVSVTLVNPATGSGTASPFMEYVSTNANYSTENNDDNSGKTIILTVGASSFTLLDASSLTVGHNIQILNNTGSTLTLSSTDTIIGTWSTLGDGLFAYATLTAAGTWAVSVAGEGGSGGGDGTIGGTIADDQIAFGSTTADAIEGSNNLTWDGTEFAVIGDASFTGLLVFDGGSDVNPFTILSTAATSHFSFGSTDATHEGSVSYIDNGGLVRTALVMGNDIVRLANRASNGIVQIRANTATEGEGGEVLVATFEDDLITLVPDLVTAGGIKIDSAGAETFTSLNAAGKAMAMGAGTSIAWFEFDSTGSFQVRPNTRANLEAGSHPGQSSWFNVDANGNTEQTGGSTIGGTLILESGAGIANTLNDISFLEDNGDLILACRNNTSIFDPSVANASMFKFGELNVMFSQDGGFTLDMVGFATDGFVIGGYTATTLPVPTALLDVLGDIKVNSISTIHAQENLDVDSAGAEMVAQVAIADVDSAFFDYVIKSGTNLQAGRVMAIHDGTNVEYTLTSTSDLGDCSDVELSVDISGGFMRLIATVLTDNWSVKASVISL